MATHFDNFSGATPGSTPTGWTLRNRDGAGDIWAMNAFDDSGNIVARLDNLSGDDNLTYITHDGVGSISGACEILAKWRIQTGEAINQKSSLVWIYANTAATAGYAAMWRSTEFRIVQLSGGGENAFVGSAYTGFSPAVNTWYWTRFGVDGSGNFYAKFWADGGAEPGTNNITGTDTAITSGFMGVGGMTYTALSDFDLVGLATGGDAAPSSSGGATTTTILTSNATVTDQTVSGAVRNRLLQDLLSVAEGSTFLSTIYGLLLSDNLLISDQSSQFFRRTRLAESNIVITDAALSAVIGSAILTRVLTSNIDVTDGAVYSILRNRLLQDTLVISEGQLEAYTTTNFLADDELTVADSIVTRLLLTRLLGDSIDLSDSAIATIVGQNVISAILSSTIQTSDEAVRWMNRVRFGDSLVLTADEVIKVLRFTRELTDTIDAADQSLSALQRFILLTDALSVDDSIVSLVNTPTTADPVILIGFDQPRIDIGGYAI